MNLTDIIALAKQGYKPDDIKELIALGNTAPDNAGGQTQTDTDGQTNTQTGTDGTETTQTGTNGTEDTQTGTDNTQLEAMQEEIKKLQTQLSDTTKALKTAQQANTQHNVQGNTTQQSDADAVAEWAKSFM